MSFSTIPLTDFDSTFGSLSEVSGVVFGGEVVAVSDDFFAPASDLLKTGSAIAYPGVFNANGSVMDGWESRRHNLDHDWAIIKLATSSCLKGFDIDTTHFAGNEAPEASVDAIFSPNVVPANDSPLWTSLLPPVPLGPSSRHLFALSSLTAPFTHLRLNNIPDGGIARFRAYGLVHPSWLPSQSWDREEKGQIDLAHGLNGGRCVWSSDERYGGGQFLVLPGRGETMEDGWHTRRSRTPEHSDQVVIKLGAPGTISELNIDTHHFIGNFPTGVAVHAINSSEEISSSTPNDNWTQILPRSKVEPHKENFFVVDASSEGKVFNYVRMTVYPDGGVKRLRVFGKRA